MSNQTPKKWILIIALKCYTKITFSSFYKKPFFTYFLEFVYDIFSDVLSRPFFKFIITLTLKN